MFACINGCFEVHGAEPWRRSQKNYINSAIDQFLICIQTDEAFLRSHFHFIGKILLQPLEAILQLTLKNVCHGGKNDVVVRGEGLAGCARAASTATDQTNSKCVRVLFGKEFSWQNGGSGQHTADQG